MGRYRRNRFDDGEMLRNNPDFRYIEAYRRVKRIKGFYTHLAVYIIFNTIIVFTNYHSGDFWLWHRFSTALFWGIGLAAHGFSVFGRDIFFGQNWEERKIKQLMKNEKENKWE